MTETLTVKKESPQAESTQVQRSEATVERPRYLPPTDIYERDDGLVLLMDMPGIDEKNIDVRVENGVLTVWGRAERDPELGDRTLLLHEYDPGDYYRSFTLNEEVDVDKVEAEYHNGVLRIFLPKAEAVRPRKIPVKSA